METGTREALNQLDLLLDELVPTEQARMVWSLVERVVVGPAGADIRLRVEGLTGRVRNLAAIGPETLRAVA